VCREAVPQIGGEDWESPLADGSKAEGWHDQLVGGRQSKSLSRWHISDLGEVGRQIHTERCTSNENGISAICYILWAEIIRRKQSTITKKKIPH